MTTQVQVEIRDIESTLEAMEIRLDSLSPEPGRFAVESLLSQAEHVLAVIRPEFDGLRKGQAPKRRAQGYSALREADGRVDGAWQLLTVDDDPDMALACLTGALPAMWRAWWALTNLSKTSRKKE